MALGSEPRELGSEPMEPLPGAQGAGFEPMELGSEPMELARILGSLARSGAP